jgi:5-formyltetrahydrofolate cyclo-ligase
MSKKMELNEIKNKIRARINAERKKLSSAAIAEKSRKIIALLRQLKEYSNANVIMTYVSLEFEPDTKEFIKEELKAGRKKILVPFTDSGSQKRIYAAHLQDFDALVPGAFGILEPEIKKRYDGKIDAVLVPGVAFDEKGNRIGRGKGCYDEFLARHNNVLKIGLAFEQQIAARVPFEGHDMPVDIIITEARVIICNKM